MSRFTKLAADERLVGNVVRHYWSVTTNVGRGEGILMPMDHVDLIVAPPGTFEYHMDGRLIVPEDFHVHGMRLHSVQVKVLRKAQVWGVSFQPWGLYLLFNVEMNKLFDGIHSLQQFSTDFSREIAEIHGGGGQLDQHAAKKMDYLIHSFASASEAPTQFIPMLRSFAEQKPENIRHFCKEVGISTRHLERLFLRCVGVSPKKFLQILRFEDSTREMIYGSRHVDLTEIGFASGFYDQSHFIRQVKKYTDYTPGTFRTNDPAVKFKLLKSKGLYSQSGNM
ncbi:helix-turn-helix domain-containing protein [Anoxynatronum buryatiense]|uniref:Helix-turn-helix domain-containing protein n=1 Tax=Anoxynatronum buryatiense TaxID=489973 RepID=A0AA45WYX6_9CLOT|nr:helix-turn-helix domain-containing protein [Anoxynatronum buryatiense]SMP70850.1 Helix-turn-helix domain-containing protein [Anoxynatronum buryatiense]